MNQNSDRADAEHDRERLARHRLGRAVAVPFLRRGGTGGGRLGAAGGAADSFGGGGGQVTSPSLMTVVPRITSSSMLTSMTPSLVLHSSSVRRSRLVA